LNTLILRQASAEARCFGDDVKLPVLAKLMLAERFNSRVFELIATAAATVPDGIGLDLGPLEAAAKKKKGASGKSHANKDDAAGKKPSAKSDAASAKGEISVLLAEWFASPNTLEWTGLEPSLAKTDLRPYLFVTKDRKDFFGAGTAFGQIASIAERLMGAKLAVKGEETNLRSLAPPEAAQVFEMLRTRIIASDSFEKAPDGVDGIGVLVRAQPSLQTNLLDFLEALTANRLGPWGMQRLDDGSKGCRGRQALRSAARGVEQEWKLHPETHRCEYPPDAHPGRAIVGTSNSCCGSGGSKPLIPSWLSDGGDGGGPDSTQPTPAPSPQAPPADGGGPANPATRSPALHQWGRSARCTVVAPGFSCR
jgi:hypothetical protein